MAAYVVSVQKADGTWCYPEVPYAPRSSPTPAWTISSYEDSYTDVLKFPDLQTIENQDFDIFYSEPDSGIFSDLIEHQNTGKGESLSAVQHVIKFTSANSATKFWAVPEMRQIIYKLLLIAPGELEILDDKGCISCEELGIKCNRIYSDRNCWPCCQAKRQCVLSWCLPVALQTNDPTIENHPSTKNKDIWPHILRICHAMYIEALPVLYGHNTFLMRDSSDFILFATWNRGLLKLTHLFGFPSTDEFDFSGRLMLMKKLHIKATGPGSDMNRNVYNFKEDPFESFYFALDNVGPSLQKWALQPHTKLKIDFSCLQLTPEAGFDVQGAFFQLISSLKILEVAGLSHKGTLQMIKETMEQHGGRLIEL